MKTFHCKKIHLVWKYIKDSLNRTSSSLLSSKVGELGIDLSSIETKKDTFKNKKNFILTTLVKRLTDFVNLVSILDAFAYLDLGYESL